MLDIGISSERFWSMTYTEVVDEINAFGRRREADIYEQKQLRAMMDYQLAQLIGVMFNDTKKYPKSLRAAYPDLFPESSSGWQDHKEKFRMYADEFNRQREAIGL